MDRSPDARIIGEGFARTGVPLDKFIDELGTEAAQSIEQDIVSAATKKYVIKHFVVPNVGCPRLRQRRWRWEGLGQ